MGVLHHHVPEPRRGLDGRHVALLERVIYDGQTFHHAGGWCKCEHCDPAPPAPVARPHGCQTGHVFVPGNDECVICGRSANAA